MAVGIDAQYGPGKAAAPSAGYPFGSGQNIGAPSDGTGTPYEAAWFNDYVGFFSGLLDEVGEVPSGNPDTTLVSQYKESIKKAQPYIDVRAFGAVGDGATDDTAAIQNAINFVSALGGGALVFKGGTFLSDKLNLVSRIRLISVGGILKLNDSQDSALLEIPIGADYVFLDDLEIDGNGANNTGTPATVGLITILSTGVSPTSDVFIKNCLIENANQNAIYLNDGARRIHIDRCRINQATNGSCIVLSAVGDTTRELSITNCTLTGAFKARIRADGIVLGAMISNNFIDGSVGDDATLTTGDIFMRDGANRDLVLTGNVCTNSTVYGIRVGGSNITIADNTVRGHSETGILLHALLDAQCEFCSITGNSVKGGTTTSARFGIGTINAFGVVITGNNVDTGSDVGIQIQNVGVADQANRFVISGNSVDNFMGSGIRVDGDAGVRNGSIVGNVVSGVNPNLTTAGIQLEDCQDCTVTGNRSGDSQAGINEVAPSNNNVFVGNNVRGNIAGLVVIGIDSIQSANLD